MLKPRIMIVEDESIVAMDLQYRLESLGYSVVFICDSGQVAIEKAKEIQPDLILMDVVLKGKIDGITAAENIINSYDIPIIYLTAYGDDKTIARAKLTQPYSYILKPFETRDLHTALEMALYKHQVALRLKENQKALEITNECFLKFGSRPQENIKRVVESVGQILKGFYAVYSKEVENSMVAVEGWNIPIDFLGTTLKNGTISFDLIGKYKDLPVVVFNLDKSDYFQTDFAVKKYELKVFAGCVVKANNKIVGSLCVVYQQERDISDDELKIMSVLARAIGIEEERKLAQEQLIGSSRMAGIGVLSSGIAHEFNNLLAIMRTKSEMALLDRNENNFLDALNSVMNSTERAQKIVQSLLNFSRRIKSLYEEADIVFAMNETLSLVEREFQKQRINIVKHFSNVPKIYIDLGQIQQVFLNMLINVKESVGSEGIVEIDIFSEEKSIYVKISDNGPGINPEYINRIFEPFFTTKDNLNDGSRQGTGLGLFVSQGIIENHGGQIKVDSSLKGTCFTIILPIEQKNRGR